MWKKIHRRGKRVLCSCSLSLQSPGNQHWNASAWPISPLMAVITPHFPSMSLTHLTVCYPLCCSPSILINPELNDQQWHSAGAHLSQHVAVERPPVAFIYVCSRLQTRLSLLSLSDHCIPTGAVGNIYGSQLFLLISDTHPVMYTMQLDVYDLSTNVNESFLLTQCFSTDIRGFPFTFNTTNTLCAFQAIGSILTLSGHCLVSKRCM